MNVEYAVNALADLFARRRTGGHVYMDGSHNPLPTEWIDARQFIEDLVAAGWSPGEGWVV
jgi:hypothetical protein